MQCTQLTQQTNKCNNQTNKCNNQTKNAEKPFTNEQDIVLLVLPREVPSMELVPPNSEQITNFTEGRNIPTKKVKVQVRACQTLILFANLQQKVKV